MDTTVKPSAEMNESVSSNQTNGTNMSALLDNFYFYQTEEIVFLSILLFCIVVGNCIVLLAVGLSKRRHSRMHFFIMHLALADLSVGLVTVLGDLVWKITVKWYAGDVMCKLVKFAQAFVMFASTYMLVALSIDRYDAIARPLFFSTTWTRCKVLVGTAWGLSALFASPLLFVSSVTDGTYECWMTFTENIHWLIYFICVMTAVLVLPALIIAGCYTLIILIIWKNSHLLESARPKQVYTAEQKFLMSSSNESTTTNNGVTPSGSPRSNRIKISNFGGRSSKGVIPQAKIRTIKMTFTIVTAFIICWSPYFIFNLLYLLGYIPRTQQMVAVSTFIQSLAPLNSAANPVIYGIFSTRICRYLRQLKMFRCIATLFCCEETTAPRSSGFSEFSNFTDTCGDNVRRSPRNCTEYIRRSPRNSDDFLCKSQRTLDAHETSVQRSPRLVSFDRFSNKQTLQTGNNVEMCDFILITVKRDNKLTI